MNEEKNNIAQVTENISDELLPKEINTLPVDLETVRIADGIVKATDVDTLKSYTDLFALNMAKKNAVRILKLNNLLDAVNDQAIERFTRRPDEISNKEILDYMKTVQEQIDHSKQTLENIGDKPMITVNNQNNEVNINVGGELDRDSKERVIDAIKALLKQAKQPVETEEVDKSDTNVV